MYSLQDKTHQASGRKRRVLWYTLDGDISKANEILSERGVSDEIELVAAPHEAYVPPTPEQLAGCDAIVNERCAIRGKTVEDCVNAGIRLVASMSIGINHIDVSRLAKHGILVSNCPGYCAEEVATHAMALMLDVQREITFSNRNVLAGRWAPKVDYPIHRMSSQVLGLIFFGHIARAVVPMAQGLGMRVIVWAPTKSADEIAKAGCQKVDSLEELLRKSDVVSLHCPLVAETKGLIGAHELELMGPNAFLINTARGECVNEDALVDALEAGTIRGAGIDTLTHEVHDQNIRLVNNPHCIVTPHVAFDSEEAADTQRHMALSACIEFLVEGKRPEHTVSAK
jgi:D-3-phosphoglycerate dehydrogenase